MSRFTDCLYSKCIDSSQVFFTKSFYSLRVRLLNAISYWHNSLTTLIVHTRCINAFMLVFLYMLTTGEVTTSGTLPKQRVKGTAKKI